MSSQKKRIGVRLNLKGQDAEAYFYLLKEQQDDIESEFSEKLEWEELPQRKSCVVALHKNDSDPQDKDDWKSQHKWMASILKKFDEGFRKRLRELEPADWAFPEYEDDT